MTEVAVVAPVRTPIGRFGGQFAGLTAVDLGAVAARGALERAGVQTPAVDLLVFGHARQAGNGPNPARQIVRRAGLPDRVPAWTVNQACGSGLRAVLDARNAIRVGEASLVVAGGTESMSRVPYLLDRARWGLRMGNAELTDGMYRDGFLCPLCGLIMGETAENLVDRFGITRDDQDAFAAETQRRCEEARKASRFRDEIVPVEVERRGEILRIDRDEHPRDGVTAASLAKLPPVFRETGTVHAGNSSGITDGAAACVVMPLEEARRLPARPACRIVDAVTCGVEPEVMGIGPVPAVRELLRRTGTALPDIDLYELNEAFAAQALACIRELDLDPSRLNVNGGAIALGHPIGCTGARILTTLMHELERRSGRLGLATLCISGGMGIAVLIERIK